MVAAMEAFVPCRCRISPAMRWEKNSIGMRRIFHMNSLLPTTAILPLIFRAYTAWIHAVTTCARPITVMSSIKGISSSRFSPVSSRSIKKREKTGLMMPKR